MKCDCTLLDVSRGWGNFVLVFCLNIRDSLHTFKPKFCFLYQQCRFFHSDFLTLKHYHIFDQFNEVVSFLVFLSGCAILSFSGGITVVQKCVIFHEDERSSQLQTLPRTAFGNDTGSVYILNYSFVSRWLCALASLGVGSGFFALAFSLLPMVGWGPGVLGLFSRAPRVLRWRKIFKPVET